MVASLHARPHLDNKLRGFSWQSSQLWSAAATWAWVKQLCWDSGWHCKRLGIWKIANMSLASGIIGLQLPDASLTILNLQRDEAFLQVNCRIACQIPRNSSWTNQPKRSQPLISDEFSEAHRPTIASFDAHIYIGQFQAIFWFMGWWVKFATYHGEIMVAKLIGDVMYDTFHQPSTHQPLFHHYKSWPIISPINIHKPADQTSINQVIYGNLWWYSGFVWYFTVGEWDFLTKNIEGLTLVMDKGFTSLTYVHATRHMCMYTVYIYI